MTSIRVAPSTLHEAGAAIGRATDVTRALNEAAQQLRRLVRCRAIAVELPDEKTERNALAYSSGFESDRDADAALTGSDRSEPASHTEGDYAVVSSPLVGEDGWSGLLLVRVDGDSGDASTALDVVSTIAIHLTAAVDRFRRMSGAERPLLTRSDTRSTESRQRRSCFASGQAKTRFSSATLVDSCARQIAYHASWTPFSISASHSSLTWSPPIRREPGMT
jgi:hypothetical protein